MQRRGKLLAQAKNMCRNAVDAEDLVSEATLRFIETFGGLGIQDERRCEAWLVTTVANLFFMQCRKHKVQVRSAQDPNLSTQTVEQPEPPPRAAYDGISDEQFAQAVRELSPKLRTTFEMHMAGKSYQEIADAEGVPIGTISKRLYDARARLRELLRRYLKKGVN